MFHALTYRIKHELDKWFNYFLYWDIPLSSHYGTETYFVNLSQEQIKQLLMFRRPIWLDASTVVHRRVWVSNTKHGQAEL